MEPLFAADAAKRSTVRSPDDCGRGSADGQRDTETVGDRNFLGGFALGLVFGFFGTLGALLVGGPSQLPSLLFASTESDEYKMLSTGLLHRDEMPEEE